MKKVLSILIVLMTCWSAMSQTPVKVSDEVVDFNGKRCYVHVLQSGQTIHSVAQAYGNKDYEAIARKEIHSLHVGDTIWLPCKNPMQPLHKPSASQSQPASPNYIKVEPGQTLYGISRAYNVSIEDIKALNPEVAESGLKAGQMLRLPGEGPQPKTTVEQPSRQPAAKPASQPVQSPAAQPAEVRARIDNARIHVSVMMPLFIDKMGEISTTKFDVEQRGKKTYQSLEFIQFYEGVEIALKELAQMGVNVELNVVDVKGMTAADAERAYISHNVANSDVLITLLTKDAFAKVADMARKDKVFVVNTMSTRQDIIENPYVVKIMPSPASQTKAMIKSIRKHYPQAAITIVHSGHKNEQVVKDELQRQLDAIGATYSFFTWTTDNKLVTSLKRNASNVVINIYDQDRSRNRIQTSTLLNRLASMKSNPAVLYSIPDYTREYGDIDFGQLQLLSYHTFNSDLDDRVAAQKRFEDTYRDQYKTEPIGLYAPLGHDVMLYFVNGLNVKGSDFWKNPVVDNLPSMVFPIRLGQSQPGKGYENQAAEVRRLGDYRFVPESENR